VDGTVRLAAGTAGFVEEKVMVWEYVSMGSIHNTTIEIITLNAFAGRSHIFACGFIVR